MKISTLYEVESRNHGSVYVVSGSLHTTTLLATDHFSKKPQAEVMPVELEAVHIIATDSPAVLGGTIALVVDKHQALPTVEFS